MTMPNPSSKLQLLQLTVFIRLFNLNLSHRVHRWCEKEIQSQAVSELAATATATARFPRHPALKYRPFFCNDTARVFANSGWKTMESH